MNDDHASLPWTGGRTGTKTVYGPRGALALAKQYGLQLPEGVRIVVMDSAVDVIAGTEATATWGGWGGLPNSPVSWNAMRRPAFGNDVVLFIRREVLANDESILAIFAHEFHELNEFRRLLAENGGSLTVAEMNGNFAAPLGIVHQNAVQAGDALVYLIRTKRGVQ
jgi:hypothetical protein